MCHKCKKCGGVVDSNFRQFRGLWKAHADLTKEYMRRLITMRDKRGAGETAKELLQNQVDLGQFVTDVRLKGDPQAKEQGARFAGLLTEHIKLAVKAIDMIKQDGEISERVEAFVEDEIALNSLNLAAYVYTFRMNKLKMEPSIDDIKEEFMVHNNHVAEIAESRVQKRLARAKRQEVEYDKHMLNVVAKTIFVMWFRK